VRQARKIMGVSGDMFYRYQEAKAIGGVGALPHKDCAARTWRMA
jgi:hypothetical protein